MIETLKEICEWQYKTFPTGSIEGTLNHLKKEIEEFEKSLKEGNWNEVESELADLFNLVNQLFRFLLKEKGFREDDFFNQRNYMENILEAKLAVLQTRKYPSKPDENGVFQHEKETKKEGVVFDMEWFQSGNYDAMREMTEEEISREFNLSAEEKKSIHEMNMAKQGVISKAMGVDTRPAHRFEYKGHWVLVDPNMPEGMFNDFYFEKTKGNPSDYNSQRGLFAAMAGFTNEELETLGHFKAMHETIVAENEQLRKERNELLAALENACSFIRKTPFITREEQYPRGIDKWESLIAKAKGGSNEG